MWGTRGSLASSGPETSRYGGNTSCVEVLGKDGTLLVLDAGTGIRRLASAIPEGLHRIDILLTHLHLDHIQGLGFFGPLYDSSMEVHIWGPRSATQDLRTRLTRYLSPPLFPVHLRSLPCVMRLHEVPHGDFEVGDFQISSAFVCHPGPTVGFRIADSRGVVTYLPDHEPALGVPDFPLSAEWTSGYALAADCDLLIHDAQYTQAQYPAHVGWGHSSLTQAMKFAALAGTKQLVLFHHDPRHGDDEIDRLVAEISAAEGTAFTVTAGAEEATFEVG